MIEPIDFSGREDEFLSSDLKQQVLAFSIIWAVLGSVLSVWLFLGKKVGPASLILDRRQAEGRVIDTSLRRSSTADGSTGFSSRLPSVRPYKKPEARRDQDWSHLPRVNETAGHAKPVVSAQSTPSRRSQSKVVPARVDAAPPQRVAAQQPSRPTKVKRPQQVAQENPERLLYPVVAGRPDPTNLASVTRRVERSMIRMANYEGILHLGLILDGSGKVLVSDAFLGDGSLNRISWNGELLRAELLARDAEYGLALLQLPAGRYGESIPLAPNPPVRGEELLAFAPSPSRCLPVTVRAGVEFAQAGFLVEGSLGSATWGTPLLNNRGELVGCQFSSLPDFPGSGVHLAADSAAIYRLLRGYNNDRSGSAESTVAEALTRLSSLARESNAEEGTRKGRIMANVGVSQFYLGMSAEQAEQWVSSPRRSRGLPGMELWSSQAPPLELVFVHDRLVAVATDYTGFSTVTGLSMGARIDHQTLSRSFDRFLLTDGLALVPGLDILLDRQGKARQFVVRPEL